MRHGESSTIRLYRSQAHSNHWIVWSGRSGWQIFPARFNGWQERQPYPAVDSANLHAVPLWMAFNTGLLEAVVARAA